MNDDTDLGVPLLAVAMLVLAIFVLLFIGAIT